MPPSRTRATGDDRGPGAPLECGRGVGPRHRIEAQLDEVGVGLGGDPLLADGVGVAPDDGDAQVSHRSTRMNTAQ